MCSFYTKTDTKQIEEHILQEKQYGNSSNITTDDYKYVTSQKDDSLIIDLTIDDDEVYPLRSDNKSEIMQVHEEMASDGLRVLGFARKLVSAKKDKIVSNDIDTNFVFIGLQAMLDPPRIETISAVQSCLSAGIKVKYQTW
jgi:magnesium-transporting ATPase (P-type)